MESAMRRAILLSFLSLSACSEAAPAPATARDATRPPDATATDRPAATADGAPKVVDQGKSADKGKPSGDVVHTGPPPANDTCAAALPLAFVAGVAAATGDTRVAFDDVNLGSPSCVKSSSNPSLSFSTPGQDLFYVVQLTGGQKYTVRLDGASASPKLLNGALYILESCTDPKSSCKVGGLVESSVWPEVVLSFTPATTASYWIGVDALGGAGGTFTLTVQ
jgi:hypothetical protein